ncbi:Asr1405/Asl0597 family protein [Calothrix rhizosoleniae]|uniref:Asr1405/Asl0597 family protein n=1 Tax=Calothrix rhizosoleniae TaxID=888997 RepID=UPI000B4A374C|nr:Asr1405/Asl0597 family protein [Calothrix rhizosoleniae]
MSQFCNSVNLGVQAIDIPISDRWQIYHRLQELQIQCWCPVDGSLQVKVTSYIDVILIRSTVIQFTASRQELINFLEKCWKL